MNETSPFLGIQYLIGKMPATLLQCRVTFNSQSERHSECARRRFLKTHSIASFHQHLKCLFNSRKNNNVLAAF